MSARQTGQVELSLTFPTSGTGDRRATLTVTDRASGVDLVDVDLTAEQFLAFSGSAHLVVAANIPDDAELARVGKTMQVHSIELGRGFPFDVDEEAVLDAACDQVLPAPWIDASDLKVSVRQGSRGWTAIYRCWTADEQED